MPLLVMGNQLDSVVDRTLSETIEHYYRHKVSGLCIRTKATHFKSMYLIDSGTQRTPLKTTSALIIGLSIVENTGNASTDLLQLKHEECRQYTSH